MYKIRVTQSAEDDLSEILSYMIEMSTGGGAAQRFVDAVAECYDRLETMPFLYEACREYRLKRLGYRKAVIQRYIMIYRVDDQAREVYILRFFPGARDYEKLL